MGGHWRGRSPPLNPSRPAPLAAQPAPAMRLKPWQMGAVAVAAALLLGVSPMAGEHQLLPAPRPLTSRRHPDAANLLLLFCICHPWAIFLMHPATLRPQGPLLCSLHAVYNTSLLLVANSCGWAWRAVRSAPLPVPPLKVGLVLELSEMRRRGALGVAALRWACVPA